MKKATKVLLALFAFAFNDSICKGRCQRKDRLDGSGGN